MINEIIASGTLFRTWGGGMERVFAHEMLREIYEQPEAIRRTLALYITQTAAAQSRALS